MNGFSSDSHQFNELWQYIQTLHPEIVQQLSKPNCAVQKVMESHLMSVLGVLPNSEFKINITSSKEDLGRLLMSAVIYGYFLNNAYQQMNFENAWQSE